MSHPLRPVLLVLVSLTFLRGGRMIRFEIRGEISLSISR